MQFTILITDIETLESIVCTAALLEQAISLTGNISLARYWISDQVVLSFVKLKIFNHVDY